MNRFPSKYAHLPTDIEEYKKFVDRIEDNMEISEANNIIADIKKKEKVDNHYRRNYKNLGLFDIENNRIKLNKYLKLVKNNNLSFDLGLKSIIMENEELMEILEYVNSVNDGSSINLKELSKRLSVEVYDTPEYSIKRWISPIIYLFKYLDLIDGKVNKEYKRMLNILENIYLKESGKYGEAIPIKKINKTFNIMYSIKIDNVYKFWNELFRDKKLIFKISLLTFPDWNKEYGKIVINGEAFTHVKISKSIIK